MPLGLSNLAAEPMLEKVIGVAPCVIYVFNQQTMSNEFSNQGIGEYLGYTPDEIAEFGARLLPMLAHPDDLSRMEAHFDAIRQLNGNAVERFEYRMRHRDGRWVWLLSTDAVFDRDENGAVLRHIGAAIDITAQKEAVETVRRQREETEYANRELTSFAYSISHDIKSPANTLELLLSELQNTLEGSNSEVQSLLAASRETVARMRSVVDDTLSYTKVIGSSFELAPVCLNAVLADVLKDLRPGIDQSSATITLADLPTVRADKTQMYLLFLNLVSNALKYQPPGRRPEVSVDLKSRDPVTIAVADNGIGIPQNKQDEIFVMFKRLHREDQYSGTGLGLATCRRITLNHGGSISVASQPGEGSVFTVTLGQP